jgi:hypothetical protein
LYTLTFRHIIVHTRKTADAGILRPEVIKKRKQQNTLNIYLTFWIWLAQFITNLTGFIAVKMLYGKSLFVYTFVALTNLTINFAILPIFYMVGANDVIKAALSKRNFREAVRLFLFQPDE